MARSFVGQIKSATGPLLGTVLTIPSPVIAQLAGLVEGEFVMIDMEHAPMTIDIVTQMVSAYTTASCGQKYPLVRIPSHGVEWVKWALDSGAAGIIVPMVNNEAEMRAIIDKAIYPPGGRRSFGPIYAPFAHPEGPSSGIAGYMARAKAGEVALLPMIESKEGLQNVEEILSMPEVSGTFIGPADLRLSLGLSPAVDGTEPQFMEALERIRTVAKKHGKVVGTMGMTQEIAKKRAGEGMDFLLSTFDNGALMTGWGRDLAAARQGAKEASAKM